MLRIVSTGLLVMICGVVSAVGDVVLTKKGLLKTQVSGIEEKDGRFVLRHAVGALDVREAVVVHMDRKVRTTEEGTLVRFVDGSRLYARGVTYNGVVVKMDTVFGHLEVAPDYVRMAVFLKRGLSERRVEELTAGKKSKDYLIMATGKAVPGDLHEMGGQTVKFESTLLGGVVQVMRKDLAAVVFALLPGVGERPKPGEVRLRAHLVDGGTLRGVLKSGDGRTFLLKNAAGEFKVRLDKTEALYFAHPDVVFLSDLDPREAKETPFFDRFLYPWQRDRTLEKKTAISIKRRLYHKGVSVHSKCELTYDLAGRYLRLITFVGLDDEARGKGNVDLSVSGDGKTLFEKKGLKGADEPVLVNAALEGVKELKLLVDFGRELDVLDRVAWADAFLVKKPGGEPGGDEGSGDGE